MNRTGIAGGSNGDDKQNKQMITRRGSVASSADSSGGAVRRHIIGRTAGPTRHDEDTAFASYRYLAEDDCGYRTLRSPATRRRSSTATRSIVGAQAPGVG